MINYDDKTLKDALTQVTSLLNKLKAIDINKQVLSKKTLILNRIKALEVSKCLIEDKISNL